MKKFIKFDSKISSFETVCFYSNKNYQFVNFSEEYKIKDEDILVLTLNSKNFSLDLKNEPYRIQKIIEKYPNNFIFYDLIGEEDFNIKIEHSNLYFLYGNYPSIKKQNYFYFPFYWWLIESICKKTYIPQKNYEKKFLMPVAQYKKWRERFIHYMTFYLKDAIYSQVYKKIYLPNDGSNNSFNDRFFNPSWYDSTFFSLVLETNINNNSIFITEKTFKPIQYFHPYMVMGSKNSLKLMKDWGFQTFENLFDESYDEEEDFIKKVKIIQDNIENFNYSPYDSITKEKLELNYNNFYQKKQINQYSENVFFPEIEKVINSQ